MKKVTLLVILLWLPTVIFTWQADVSYFYWRHQLTILTGALGLAYMTLAMVLAMRIPKLEEYVNGLDKAYAVHKRMGIAALISLVTHWLLIESPKVMIALDLIASPQRRQRLGQLIEGINWIHWGKIVGEYTFYIFLAFTVISLVQAISYRKFRFTHKIAGAIYLAGVFHSVILLDYQWNATALNFIVWAAAVIGSICAVISLTGGIGRTRIVEGQVSTVKRIHDQTSQSRVLHVTIKVKDNFQYKAGQFAYVNFHDGEAPHPFSVLNYDRFNQELEFAIKDLGDYTHTLYEHLLSGTFVSVEGGYGRFSIPESSSQIWIGAGIGIVPFIAWLHHLCNLPHSTSRHIELFYCRDNDNQIYFVQMLERLVHKLPYVHLHIYTASQNEFLCAERVAQKVNLHNTSVSFCGPVSFGSNIKNHLINMGLPKNSFHSERFEMR